MAALLMVAGGVLQAQAFAAPVCSSAVACWESPEFAVTVSNVRNSKNPYNTYYVSATLRFTNKTAQPLMLAHEHYSPKMTDDRGNRFSQRGHMRGMPHLQGNDTDTDFTLQPGVPRDTQIEFEWSPGRDQFMGSRYDLEMIVRDLKPMGGNRVLPSREYPVLLRGLTEGNAVAMPAAAPVPAPGLPSAVPPSPAPAPNAAARTLDSRGCAGVPTCFAEGPLMVKVSHVTTLRKGAQREQIQASVNLEISNRGNQPLVLAYKLGSAHLVDDKGNPYSVHGPGNLDQIAGIGVLKANAVDTSFRLAPGATRRATLRHGFSKPSGVPLGNRFSYELALVELDVSNPSEISAEREYAVSLRNLEGVPADPPPKSEREEFEEFQQQERQEFRGNRR